MPERPKLEKAKIFKLDSNDQPILSKVVECQFNPKEFVYSWQLEWKAESNIGGDTPRLTFAGGKAQDMTVDLLFDSTETGKDVRDSYKTLLEITAVDPRQENTQTRKGAPSHCQFQWGKLLSFNAVIKTITQTFTMFTTEGTPLRARVQVVLTQCGRQPARQNPTSYSEPWRTWVVTEGDRLDWIAYREYGNPAYWRHIAETNNLMDPTDLRPGQVLKLVPLP